MAGEKVVLETSLGKLRGQTKISKLSGKIYYAFQGIPYAKPPLGSLRFKAPQPIDKWEGIRDALEEGNDPIQDLLYFSFENEFQFPQGDEDCLYLNVYMNKLPEEGSLKRPVMVYIHGGGFAGGNGSTKLAGPDNMMESDIVFVPFNYRCGALGFLSLENESVPGNAGLKDQTLALKWVRDNIQSFGGDPNNVTIFGISAGGASVDYHLISPFSSGLFHKAIIQSGFSTNPWAQQQNPRSLATSLAKKIGSISDDPDKILEFLQAASVSDILDATQKIADEKDFKGHLNFVFTPCVEVSGSQPFLTEAPEILLKKGVIHKVPIIVGCAANEGFIFGLPVFNDENFESINKSPEKLVPRELKLKPGTTEEREAAKAIMDFYFKGKSLCWETINEYTKYSSDYLFNNGMEKTRTAFLQESKAPVYSYLFTNHSICQCSAMRSMFPENVKRFMKSEACHGADIAFLLTVTFFGPYELTTEDKEAVKKHVKAWTNFACYGDPNCKELGVPWEQDSSSKPCFMEIGTTWTMRTGIPFGERFDFWKELYSKYYHS